MSNRPLIESLAAEYSAAVRAAGYSDPLQHPELITDADFDAVEEANPGLTFQPEHRLLGTVFGITSLPGGDEILRPEAAVRARDFLWSMVDEHRLYEGYDIGWWPARGVLPPASFASTMCWFRDGEYWTFPVGGSALSGREDSRMAAPSIEAWLRFNIALLETGSCEHHVMPASQGGTDRDRSFWAAPVDDETKARLAAELGCAEPIYGAYFG